jgi:hypothetical protein
MSPWIQITLFTLTFAKITGVCGNQAFLEMLGFSSIAEAFSENVIYLTMFKFWELHNISKTLF